MPVSGMPPDQNHAWLIDQFVQLLLRHEPRSVLDVGCGAGRLMRALNDAGVETVGVDQPGPNLDGLSEQGFDVREGSAYALDAGDQSVDWVTLRHVPHHLEDPARAFAEALRVARQGVLVAEPTFDTSLDSQRGALALDIWEKRQHRRAGRIHGENLELDELLSAFPADIEATHEVAVARHLRLARRSVAEFAKDAELLVAKDPDGHPERLALKALLADLESLGLSWNGSLCVSLKLR